MFSRILQQKLLTLATVLVAGVGCGVITPTSVTNPAEVQQLARITIPASATGLQCRTIHGKDSLYYGRFEIPASDLTLVLGRMPKENKAKPFTGYSNVTSHQMSESWWQPGQLKNPQVAEWSEPGFSVNLMFGESGHPNTLTVYFFNFSL